MFKDNNFENFKIFGFKFSTLKMLIYKLNKFD